MMKFLLTILHLSIIFSLSAQKQPISSFARCQTTEALKYHLNKNEDYKSYYHSVYNLRANKNAQIAPLEPVVVPVAFHFSSGVLSCAQENCLVQEVEDQLRYLNEAFGDNSNSSLIQACPAAYEDANGNSVVSTGTSISFCYAIPPTGNAQGLDPYCDPPITIGDFDGGNFATNGTGATGWDNILNIFITNGDCLGVSDGLPGKAIADGVTVCAAAFGGIDGANCNLGTDAIYNLGKTLVHEIGHYLGLFHTFEGACTDEPDNAGPYDVDDTPALLEETAGCPTGCATSCEGPIATANFMDYTDDACMGLFSKDQALVMNFWANTLFGAQQFNCNANQTLAGLNTVCNNNNCNIVCPSLVNNQIKIVQQYCGSISNLSFPNPKAFGLSLNSDSNGEVFTWSVNNYTAQGGTTVSTPSDIVTSACIVATQTYYLNISCYNNPSAPTLNGGTYQIQVYPMPPEDLGTLIQVTNQNTCNEPIIVPVNGCDNYISTTPAATNPIFPVNVNDNGIANYTVNFTPNPNGPNCCNIPVLEGEILDNGDFELGAVGWNEIEEAPPGSPSSSPYGIIGLSAGTPINVNGSSDAWFGGYGSNTLLAIEQTVEIPACNTLTLQFDFKTNGCSNTNDIVFSFLIDNVTFVSINCDNATNGNRATFGPFDIPVTNAGNALVRFQAVEKGTNPTTSFSLDNVSLKAKDCPIPRPCSQQISANYNCTNSCSSSLNLSNLVNNSQSFQASSNILSTANINANVIYKAGEFIKLNNGFTTNKNFNFVAKIENCD